MSGIQSMVWGAKFKTNLKTNMRKVMEIKKEKTS